MRKLVKITELEFESHSKIELMQSKDFLASRSYGTIPSMFPSILALFNGVM
jgi:hypothetical protein